MSITVVINSDQLPTRHLSQTFSKMELKLELPASGALRYRACLHHACIAKAWQVMSSHARPDEVVSRQATLKNVSEGVSLSRNGPGKPLQRHGAPAVCSKGIDVYKLRSE